MPVADLNAPVRGAYVDINDLIALRFPARQLSLTRQNRALNILAGPNKTNFRGRGIDFEEVRAYQSGDDVRAIDWRVTARTGNPHTKLFREERERPVLVVVDQRTGMFFGSAHCFKSVLAAHIASLLTWAALIGGDRVGGLVFNEAGHREIRPRRSRRTALGLLSEIEAYNCALPRPAGDDGDGFAPMLAKLRRIARPGSSIFLISDFLGATEAVAREQLFELAKHTEITAVQCTDPLEAQLPRSGTYAVTDGRERSELYTGDRRLRARYAAAFLARRDALTQDMGRLGIPLLVAATDRPPFALLQGYYGDRRR